MAEISHENFGRLIDLAGELVKEIKPGPNVPRYDPTLLDLRVQSFDTTLKALFKTVLDLEDEQE